MVAPTIQQVVLRDKLKCNLYSTKDKGITIENFLLFLLNIFTNYFNTVNLVFINTFSRIYCFVQCIKYYHIPTKKTLKNV